VEAISKKIQLSAPRHAPILVKLAAVLLGCGQLN
jgi:hypothetical protein